MSCDTVIIQVIYPDPIIEVVIVQEIGPPGTGGGGGGSSSSYEAISFSAAGDSVSSPTSSSHKLLVTPGAGAGAYTHTISFSDSGRSAGDSILVDMPSTSTNPRVEFHDGSSSGTLLFYYQDDGSSQTVSALFVFNGTAWAIWSVGFSTLQ